MPDFYAEYHALCGSGMHGHFASILCHGIFERFPRDPRAMLIEGGLVPFVGLLWRLDTIWRACRTEIPWCVRAAVGVRLRSRPLRPPSRSRSRPTSRLLAAGDRGPAAVRTRSASRATIPHWDFDEPAQTLRRLPDEWRDDVAHANAAAFFRLPVPVPA